MRIMLDVENRKEIKTVDVCHVDFETNPHDKSQRLLLYLCNGQIISVLNEDYVDVEKLLKEINKKIFETGKYYLDCLDYRFV